MYPSCYSIACLITALLLLDGCKERSQTPESRLGDVQFVVSGNAEAQPVFTRGLLLLHSFEYTDAREAFQQVRALDPGFVMAYWGEAMTHNHPLWQEQDYDQGNEVLRQLAPTAEERLQKAATGMERDFLEGIHILYGPGDKATRDSLYAVHMGMLYDKYPAHDEVAAFYSLALNGWGTTEKDPRVLEKAAEIGFEILDRNPDHPGALHYVIHAYDDPKYAEKALAVADKYALVAPDAGHALHMPTHTYVALGQWDKVVTSNIVSWEAEKARKERKGLDNSALGYHAYHWLLYGRLQSGDPAAARSMVDSMHTFCEELPNPRSREHMVLLKTTYLAETGDYMSDVTPMEVDLKGLNIATRAKDRFVLGMACYQRRDISGLDTLIKHMADERVMEDLKTPAKGIRMCGNIAGNITTKDDLRVAEAMESELRAMRAMLANDHAAAEAFLQKAVRLEDECGYAFGPPSIVKPAHELYGEWLLDRGRAEEALRQFELSLAMAPNRRLSVDGRDRARSQLAM